MSAYCDGVEVLAIVAGAPGAVLSELLPAAEPGIIEALSAERDRTD
jgi:hypothetical protein